MSKRHLVCFLASETRHSLGKSTAGHCKEQLGEHLLACLYIFLLLCKIKLVLQAGIPLAWSCRVLILVSQNSRQPLDATKFYLLYLEPRRVNFLHLWNTYSMDCFETWSVYGAHEGLRNSSWGLFMGIPERSRKASREYRESWTRVPFAMRSNSPWCTKSWGRVDPIR